MRVVNNVSVYLCIVVAEYCCWVINQHTHMWSECYLHYNTRDAVHVKLAVVNGFLLVVGNMNFFICYLIRSMQFMQVIEIHLIITVA